MRRFVVFAALIGLLLVSSFRFEKVYTGKPQWLLWGDKDHIVYNARERAWYNHNTAFENWRRGSSFAQPERVPERTEWSVRFDPLWGKQDQLPAQVYLGAAVLATSRRFVLINVEQTINELGDPNDDRTTEYRTWAHLGILSVGTAAYRQGWDIHLHDELVEGPVDLECAVQPGDVVGLSLVVTGIERGIKLARQAKELGASCVIAGNDSAIFRARQILTLPDTPIDAVFTGNSLTAVARFFRQVESTPLDEMQIPGVAVVPTQVTDRSNERLVILAERSMRRQARAQGEHDPEDVFIVPEFSLYSDAYWQRVWDNYRRVSGHKHRRSNQVRNALALFAQGCTRTGKGDVCSYCTIAGVADIRIPGRDYLERLLQAYADFGIDYVFNVTDSSFEMRSLVRTLAQLGARFDEGLMMYGRAYGIARHPELIDQWHALTPGHLLLNVGMDAGDEQMLSRGVVKASQSGHRLSDNRRAVQNIRASGAHLHYSLIFGSPGETVASCERSLEFFEWSRAQLGPQLYRCETDIYWLNHGSPVSRVFRDYQYARYLASLAGKEISHATWVDRFYRHRDTVVVPWSCQEAWYDCFTGITIAQANEYNAHVARVMAQHTGAIPGRAFKPNV